MYLDGSALPARRTVWSRPRSTLEPLHLDLLAASAGPAARPFCWRRARAPPTPTPSVVAGANAHRPAASATAVADRRADRHAHTLPDRHRAPPRHAHGEPHTNAQHPRSHRTPTPTSTPVSPARRPPARRAPGPGARSAAHVARHPGHERGDHLPRRLHLVGRESAWPTSRLSARRRRRHAVRRRLDHQDLRRGDDHAAGPTRAPCRLDDPLSNWLPDYPRGRRDHAAHAAQPHQRRVQPLREPELLDASSSCTRIGPGRRRRSSTTWSRRRTAIPAPATTTATPASSCSAWSSRLRRASRSARCFRERFFTPLGTGRDVLPGRRAAAGQLLRAATGQPRPATSRSMTAVTTARPSRRARSSGRPAASSPARATSLAGHAPCTAATWSPPTRWRR